jgi:hypothetical protein
MKQKETTVDFCVVGGGMAGLCAALAAARMGVKTALIQDRPVLGGNASSEIRMWISGAHGENNHETGILEEILLENQYRQSFPSYSVWDSVLWEKAHFQDNLVLLLNCSVNEVGTSDDAITWVRGWQLTTETWHTVSATLFADCTGDGTIGAMAGAEYRQGRETRNEFDESIAPATEDKKTMGLSCLIQAREMDSPQEFIPPTWAYRYNSDGELPERNHSLSGNQNFWWLEVGGMDDSIHDTEDLRDELLKIAFGVFDHIKNRGDHDADNWALDWVGFLPGKRESRRFVGDHILNQNDVEAEGRHFPDIVAFGGWTMDDHFPEGFYKKEAGTIFHPAPSPYGIPYRSLYSRNVKNLFFAGRNISATHTALSSTRVMATCSVIGQAMGTAAGIAALHGLTPREVYEQRLGELQDTLQMNDCYLPFRQRSITEATAQAEISSSWGDDAEQARNGWDRQIGDEENAWHAEVGEWIAFSFDSPRDIERARIVFDSDLSRTTHHMVSKYPKDQPPFRVPSTVVKRFRIEADPGDGSWESVAEVEGNYQRLVWVDIGKSVRSIRITPLETWGAESFRIFAVDLYGKGEL